MSQLEESLLSLPSADSSDAEDMSHRNATNLIQAQLQEITQLKQQICQM